MKHPKKVKRFAVEVGTPYDSKCDNGCDADAAYSTEWWTASDQVTTAHLCQECTDVFLIYYGTKGLK